MDFDQIRGEILEEIKKVILSVKKSEVENLLEAIIRAKRVFAVSGGREGLALRAFAMRLMHLGKISYWIWDDTTPSIEKGDLLVVNCGSGDVISVVNVVRRAKEAGASVATITANPQGDIAKLSNVIVELPAPVMQLKQVTHKSCQPMGTLFEQGLFILHDITVLLLMEKLGIAASEMAKRHRNVE